MAGKISKQELEGPDAFQSTVESIKDYIYENQKRFYSIVAAIGIAALIAFGIYMYVSSYQESARDMYAKAQNNVAQNAPTPENMAKNIKLYQDLANKYSHSWSARMAHYHLGNIYYSMGDYDKAIADYNKFVSSRISDNAGIKFLALSSIGYCYEAKNDFKKALEYFEKAQKTNNAGFESVGFSNIGRAYELLNDKKNALENYKKALEKSNDPSKADFIKHKISSLS
jgi:predicted negative regulator of RcsB-dependent stress response